ncbi:N-acetylmuramoyl-L-alanine amidase [Streptomyces sp. ms191]|uniref:peptidoglycan recognition protein family protein n=1 Tax=Streptomyces sp. ms191 TaxID=1827978 RepID=UPI0011CE5260|nr:peptidoglycan recognition protein [Streptomyces sp. ms191]TXS29981.1 N-acetylmuramoyl-L-alanine amidase [Streptomyces sp. ms191]
MRAYLSSSIAVTCAAVLTLPLTLATPAVSQSLGPPAASTGVEPELAGSTQSLPLGPLGGGERALGGAATGAAQGLTRRDVRPFSLVGVVWDDARRELHGTVEVRTRATGTGMWSDWQAVGTHNEEHGADPGTAEGASGAVRGSTAPLWVGDSDGVEIRVRPELPGQPDAEARPETYGQPDGDVRPEAYERPDGEERPAGRAAEGSELPAGMRLELVDPGPEPGAPEDRAGAATRTSAAAEAAGSVANTELAPAGATEIPALSRARTEATLAGAAAAKPYIGPRPKIITRKGWGADEKLRERGFVYTKSVKAAFVHHTVTGNRYTCKQAPSILRSIYRYHVKSSGWRDFGYNFAVDKCGNIYEGRAGGVAKAVLGAHTRGFNTNSMGIAVLGTYGSASPPAAVVTAVARLTAWKLGLYGVNPKGTTYLVSGGGNRYKKGKKVKFNTISGHRDGFATECPGKRLYSKLGTARTTSAKYQGRR